MGTKKTCRLEVGHLNCAHRTGPSWVRFGLIFLWLSGLSGQVWTENFVFNLFNLYSEGIFRELDDCPEGVGINGVKTYNLRYADDAVLLTTSSEDLQRSL